MREYMLYSLNSNARNLDTNASVIFLRPLLQECQIQIQKLVTLSFVQELITNIPTAAELLSGI